MKKVMVIAAVLGTLGATQVFAQAKTFEGFSLGANVEVDHGSLGATDGSSSSDHTTGLGLQARYDWALGDQFVLGLGATASTGDRNAGAYATGVNSYTKERYSIEVMPGYALSKDMLVYAKLSAVAATALANDGTSTSTVHGTGYGIGVRGMIDNNMFWQAGLDAYRYNDVSFGTGVTAGLKNNVFAVGLGYKF